MRLFCEGGTMRPIRLVFLALPMACSAICLSSANAASPAEQKSLVIFAVRHAEKVDASRDPALSPDGGKRALALAQTLRSAGVEHVHSSDFIRTRDTAAPTAAAQRLKVQLYDPRKLPDLVKKLRKQGGRHLVVGHSNTTPQLVKLLGGEAGGKINEGGEFDRLYVVTINKDGAVQSVLLRYGKAYAPAQ